MVPLGRRLVTILGPTACGKTAVAVELARHVGGAILSCDSRQLYRGMDIGTGKDLAEYGQGAGRVPYYLIDIAEAGAQLTLYDYVLAFEGAYGEVVQRGLVPILCGGTGLYAEAILRGYRLSGVGKDADFRAALEKLTTPELVARLARSGPVAPGEDRNNRRRLIRAIERVEASGPAGCPTSGTPLVPLGGVYVIAPDRTTRRARIAQRLDDRLAHGLVEEVQGLLERGVPMETLLYYGLEYRMVTRYLMGAYTYEEMRGQLLQAIWQFAKRQMTYWRGLERRGVELTWLDGQLAPEALVEAILRQEGGA